MNDGPVSNGVWLFEVKYHVGQQEIPANWQVSAGICCSVVTDLARKHEIEFKNSIFFFTVFFNFLSQHLSCEMC